MYLHKVREARRSTFVWKAALEHREDASDVFFTFVRDLPHTAIVWRQVLSASVNGKLGPEVQVGRKGKGFSQHG